MGIDIPPERLRSIASDGPATEDEWVDVSFALLATNLLAEQRRTRRGRTRHRIVRLAVVAGAALLALAALICLGALFLSLTAP